MEKFSVFFIITYIIFQKSEVDTAKPPIYEALKYVLTVPDQQWYEQV